MINKYMQIKMRREGLYGCIYLDQSMHGVTYQKGIYSRKKIIFPREI